MFRFWEWIEKKMLWVLCFPSWFNVRCSFFEKTSFSIHFRSLILVIAGAPKYMVAASILGEQCYEISEVWTSQWGGMTWALFSHDIDASAKLSQWSHNAILGNLRRPGLIRAEISESDFDTRSLREVSTSRRNLARHILPARKRKQAMLNHKHRQNKYERKIIDWTNGC